LACTEDRFIAGSAAARACSGKHKRGHFGIDDCLAASQRLDASAEVELRNVLQKVTLSSGAHALADQLVVAKRGEHGDDGIGDGGSYSSADFRAAKVRQVRIQQHHVWALFASYCDRARASRAFTDHLDLRISAQESAQANPNHLVIVHDEYPDPPGRLVSHRCGFASRPRQFRATQLLLAGARPASRIARYFGKVEWQVTPYTFAAAGAGVVVLGLGVLGWRRRPVPGTAEFALFAVAVSDWCIAAAIGFAHADLEGKVLSSKFEYIGVVSAPVLWLLCMAAYTHVSWSRPRWLVAALAVIPLITLVLVFSNEQHGLVWSHVEIAGQSGLRLWKASYGPWFWVHSAYSYLLLGGATFLILRETRRDPFFFQGQGTLLLVGMIIPWATNVAYLTGLSPLANVDSTPFGFALGAAAVGAGLLRFGLFDVVPIAREALVEGLPDAVIVLDGRTRVVELNPAAERLLGQHCRILLGRRATEINGITELLAAAGGEISEAALRPRPASAAKDRHFDVGCFPLTDTRSRPVGQLLLIRDVTDRKNAEQQRARALREEMERMFSEAARQRSEFMVEATRELAESLDVCATAHVLCKLMVPALADWCIVESRPASDESARQLASAGYVGAEAPAQPSGEAIQLIAHGRTAGVLKWGRRSEAGSSTAGAAIQDLAARAALALDSAHLYEAERSSRASAEEAVIRIRGLYEKQQHIVGRLRELRGELEAAQRARLLDDERERIARELHDRVEQTFFGIGLSVNALLAGPLPQLVGSVRDALAVIRDSAQNGAEELRAAIFALTRAEVNDLELFRALWLLVREFQRKTGLEADLLESGAARHAPPEIAEVLHAVAREGLANVEQHARATAVVVSLCFEPKAVTLTVHDDGIGAPALLLGTLADSATRFGLNGARDRVLRLGGTFTAESGDDGGFVLRACVPLPDVPGEEAQHRGRGGSRRPVERWPE
jgi:PAS domain S-box-containing protein